MKTIIILILSLLPLVGLSQDTSIVSYLNEITSGAEHGYSKTKVKFKKDVYLIIQGNCDEELRLETIKVIDELNELITSINFYITDDIGIANVRLYFGSPSEYVKINPFCVSLIDHSWGLAFMFPKYNQIDMSLAFVDTERTSNNSQRKHILREEITQSLGFGNDSYRYPESIFYQGWTEVHEYSDIDKEVIKMFYN